MAISKNTPHTIRLPLMAASCLLAWSVCACGASVHEAESPALEDAGQDEVAPAPDASSADVQPAQNASHEDQPRDAIPVPSTHVEPIAKATDVAKPVVPTAPASPEEDQKPGTPALPPMPAPSAGVCAFIAPPDAAPSVDNANCPDGVLRGNLTIGADADIAAALGCNRVTGNVYIYTSYVSALSGLRKLRVIDGNLTISEWRYSNTGGEHGTQTLADLQPLEQLACVAGTFMLTTGESLLDATGLQHLTEVGSDLEVSVSVGARVALPGLRRVWGNVDVTGMIDTPALETIYGNVSFGSLTTAATPYIGCAADEYCRDGVLGCSYTATSQASLAALTKCEYAVHDISVQGADIDLTPLARLAHVGDQLSISAGDGATGQLRHLEVLSNLKYIRLLQVAGFPELSDLSWLPGLSSAQGIHLTDLPALADLRDLSTSTTLAVLDVERSGLHSLKGLENLPALSSLTLISNAELTDLGGAPKLRSIDHLSLVDDPALHDLSGLSGVAIGNLTVKQLPVLESLAGLEAVQPSMVTLTIDDNASLRSVDALAALRQVGFLEVLRNPQLASFHGLDALSVVNDSITVSDNQLLPQCELQSLVTLNPRILSVENDTTATCAP